MLFSRGAFIKPLPAIMWKIENVPNRLDLTKEISGQKAESDDSLTIPDEKPAGF